MRTPKVTSGKTLSQCRERVFKHKCYHFTLENAKVCYFLNYMVAGCSRLVCGCSRHGGPSSYLLWPPSKIVMWCNQRSVLNILFQMP